MALFAASASRVALVSGRILASTPLQLALRDAGNRHLDLLGTERRLARGDVPGPQERERQMWVDIAAEQVAGNLRQPLVALSLSDNEGACLPLFGRRSRRRNMRPVDAAYDPVRQIG